MKMNIPDYKALYEEQIKVSKRYREEREALEKNWLCFFAGQAMQGMLASTPPNSTNWPSDKYIAEKSLGFAKGLLKELEENNG